MSATTFTHTAPTADRSPGDASLLRRAVRGDGAAFATLYARHASAASAVARRILGPTPAAEDAVQDALLQLWRQGDRYCPARGTVRAWLLVLVRSRSLDLLRREQVRAMAAERVIADAHESTPLHVVSTEAEMARRETVHQVRSGLSALPAEQREVLGLLYLGGRTQAEVATTLDVPLGTVKGRTRLGLAKLRRALPEELAA